MMIFFKTAITGIGATLVMDLWSLLQKIPAQSTAAKLCAGWALDFMVAQRKVLASYDCLNAANTRGDVHRLGVSLPDRGHFCFCTAYAQRNRLAQRALTEHWYSGRFVDFIRTVHDSTARIWFWYRGITHPSSLAGASAQSAHASGVWGRAVYRGPDDKRRG